MQPLSPAIQPLTVDEYYTHKNQALTRSKVEDYLRDPFYFYQRHITRELKDSPPSDAMKKGSIVDAIFSQLPIQYQPKVLKRDDPILYAFQKENPDTTIGQAAYEDAVALGTFLIGQPFYKRYEKNNTTFQALLHASYDGADIAGLADAVTFYKDTVFIDDLKTTQASNVKTTRSWWYACKDKGYFRQLGFYREIARFMYPEYKNFVCRHIVATTDDRGLPQVYFFELDDRDLTNGAEEIFYAIDNILTVDSFQPRTFDWDELVHLSP